MGILSKLQKSIDAYEDVVRNATPTGESGWLRGFDDGRIAAYGNIRRRIGELIEQEPKEASHE